MPRGARLSAQLGTAAVFEEEALLAGHCLPLLSMHQTTYDRRHVTDWPVEPGPQAKGLEAT